jgi:hypothetical protein
VAAAVVLAGLGPVDVVVAADDRPALLPENPAHRPIRIGAETSIVGIVVGLFRGYPFRTIRAR